jgi:hypothetical protein
MKGAVRRAEVSAGFPAGISPGFSAGYPATPDRRQDRLYAQRTNRINRQGQRIRTHKMWGRC